MTTTTAYVTAPEECGCEEMNVQFCNHDFGEGSGSCESCVENCQDDGLPVLGVQSCEFFCSGTGQYRMPFDMLTF